MKTLKIFGLIAFATFAFTFTGCKKDEPKLPPIGGYDNADEVGKADLVAYWPLNGDGNESLSSSAPAKTSNVTWVDGIKGKAASFNVGYLAYNTIANLGTNLNTGFTVSSWVKLTNNGANSSVIFSLSRPNEWAGSINFMSETGWMPATSDSLTVKGLIVSSTDLGWQDSRNTVKASAADIAAGHIAYPNKIGGKWAHVVLTWNNTTKLLKVYVNGIKISNPVWENRDNTGTKNFVVTTPCHPILGAFETFANGTTTDAWNTGLKGQLDEVRVWKRELVLADIGALYELEKAGR
ncbi:MAG TPA: LamG domain-containing protein [Paludibacteraceae bacterium]|nr:LamG domain-containing protein [Paludibacteraceae bacterium]HPT43237.1 LamG domain-containing protein [Paludibacteraceae bacterium]